MRLPACTVRSTIVKRMPALHYHQTGEVAIGKQPRVNHRLVILAWRHGQQEPSRRLAHVYPSGAFPAAGEAGLEHTSEPKIAVHPSNPACRPPIFRTEGRTKLWPSRVPYTTQPCDHVKGRMTPSHDMHAIFGLSSPFSQLRKHRTRARG